MKVNKLPTPNGVLPVVPKTFPTNSRFLRNVIEVSKRELLQLKTITYKKGTKITSCYLCAFYD
jgi:hypothetical protein